MSNDPVADILNDPRFKGSPLTWEADPAEYDRIRHAWLTHVSAEEPLFAHHENQADWDRQLPIMLGVFTDDCVMELVSCGRKWHGQDGAAEFYRYFITAFDGMVWVPQAMVIGPQGVLDVANMSGVLVQDFAGMKATNTRVQLQWIIHVPWVPEKQKFGGERIFSIRPLSQFEDPVAGPPQLPTGAP
ncbi:MAG TPA: nuclear transport factor 2 family protein [Sphingomicrobium sp.]|nr:nuclear transport factor 2 family protein [Sphingomicrobium sp.]